jgi:pimeloyl-ACP methyl ester carboxylesterase
LVLIHGWALHGGYWDDDIENLAKRHTVIRYDRRGCGRSGGRPDVTADAADLASLLDYLGHERAHVLGHSLGGAVALTFAARYPERVDGLVLFGPAPLQDLKLPPVGDEPPFLKWQQIGQSDGIEAMRTAIMKWADDGFGGEMPPEVEQRARALLEDYQGLDLLDAPPPSMQDRPPTIEELPGIRTPTMVLLGVDEMPAIRITSEVLVYGMPNARKLVLTGGGHNVNWRQPDRFATEVLAFLREVESSR